MKMWLVLTVVLGCTVFGTAPVHAAAASSASPQEEETLTVAAAEEIADRYGFTFKARVGESMPARQELEQTLAALQQVNRVSQVSGENKNGSAGFSLSDSDSQTCQQDMWISHIDKSDGPLGSTGWRAKTEGVLHYRFLGWETEEDVTYTRNLYP